MRTAAIIREIPPGAVRKPRFVAYFWFVGWDCISLGLHVCWSLPNVEIHLPFGFVRIGWSQSHFENTWKLGPYAYGLHD